MLLCPSCHIIIDRNKEAYPVEKLQAIKQEQETWAAELRNAGHAWNMRYASVDYLNLPRIAMLSSSGAIYQAAVDVGLDAEQPFRQQGLQAGAFIGRVRPIVETWEERAVSLDSENIGQIEHGMLVSFKTKMRMRNPSMLDHPLTNRWELDPHLYFRLDGRQVLLRLDPKWLTVRTATTDLYTAEHEPAVYAGLGVVVGVTDETVRLSALIFGRPATPTQSAMEFLLSSPGRRVPRTLELNDYADNLSDGHPVSRRSPQSNEADETAVSVVLHFNEDRSPRQVECETFRQLLRVVPEYSRDLRIGWHSLPLHVLEAEGVDISDIAMRTVGGHSELWKTISVPAMAAILRTMNVAVGVIHGIQLTQARDLHDLMDQELAGYKGAVQIVPDINGNLYVGHEPVRFRIVGTELRLLYTEEEYELDMLPHHLYEEWQECALFDRVTWEEA